MKLKVKLSIVKSGNAFNAVLTPKTKDEYWKLELANADKLPGFSTSLINVFNKGSLDANLG